MNGERQSAVFEAIEVTVRKHYAQNGLCLDELVREDVVESQGKRGDVAIYKRLVLSIHNANWKAVSQETFWQRRMSNYEEALFGFDPARVARLGVDDLQDKGLIN
jgi:3-methyladenine DNA glycosylase Tag